jgi:hypothetical protein
VHINFFICNNTYVCNCIYVRNFIFLNVIFFNLIFLCQVVTRLVVAFLCLSLGFLVTHRKAIEKSRKENKIFMDDLACWELRKLSVDQELARCSFC